MFKQTQINRRRFISILAAATGLAVSRPYSAFARAPVYRWRGVVLGAMAEIQIAHEDISAAKKVVMESVAEIKRLESIFSLYRADSAITELNNEGLLKNPPLDLVRLINEATYYHEITQGAFDISVQPLWNLYARYYSASPTGPGPAEDDVLQARSLVGMKHIEYDFNKIALTKFGMQLTFNGIAQGYITDRVADLMRLNGIENVMVDLGEATAIGSHPDGRPWTAGIEHHNQTVELNDMAIATSSPSGTPFGESGQDNHLFNPVSGLCANQYKSVTVISAKATTADALSTGFSFMTADTIYSSLKKVGHSKAFLINTEDTFIIM